MPNHGDRSSLGGEKTTDVLLKLSWTPTESTRVNLKYGYTKGDDEHYPTLIPQDLSTSVNCYLPEDPKQPAQPAQKPPHSVEYIDAAAPNWSTSSGMFCGTFDVTGWENRLNLPDLYTGVTVVEDYALAPIGGTGLTLAERTATPAQPGMTRTTQRVLADATQSLGEWEVSVRAAWNDDDFNQVFDLDRQETRALVGLFHFETPVQEEDYAFEFRIASPLQRPVRGSLGAYFYHFERGGNGRSFTGPYPVAGTVDNFGVPVTAIPVPSVGGSETENIALFGSLDVDLAARWTLAIEARLADDEKTVVGGNREGDRQSTTAFTPRITLRWQPTDDLMLYTLAAKGNKPADFNTAYYGRIILLEETRAARNDGRTVVEEEIQWTYETGIKSTWLDRRLTANLSAFFIDWKNQSIFVQDTIRTVDPAVTLPTTIRQNAGRTEIIGFEIETNFALTDNLFLIANYGYNEGEITSGFDSNLEATTGSGDLAGKEIPNAPRNSAVLGLVATTQVTTAVDALLRADYVYESDRWTQAGNFNRLDERKLVNVRLGLEAGNWGVTGYVNNLLDDDTPWTAPDFVDFQRSLANGSSPRMWSMNPMRGRHYGLELSYRF